MDRVSHQDESLCVRDRLLNAAERVVSRDGVKNCTLEAVAQEAGVSKGGLLYHFPSKSALITAVVERLAEKCDTDQCRLLADDRGPGAFTRAYLAARSHAPDPGEQPIHSAILAAAGTDPQFLDPFRARFVEWQARLIADGIEPETAMIVRLAIDGLCLCRMLGVPVPEGELQTRVMDRLMSMTHAGTKKNEEMQS